MSTGAKFAVVSAQSAPMHLQKKTVPRALFVVFVAWSSVSVCMACRRRACRRLTVATTRKRLTTTTTRIPSQSVDSSARPTRSICRAAA